MKEIVDKLLRNRRKLEFLNEDIDPLYEADEDEEDDYVAPDADEEYAALSDDEFDDTDIEDKEMPHDDSQAPIQGDPDDSPEDTESPAEFDEAPPIPSSPRPSGPSMPTEEPPVEEPPVEEAPTDNENAEDVELYDNPLDNQYAVKFTMGDDIKLTYSGDSKEVKAGVVDGYDSEGFYRVKWKDGTSTNGLTDIALSELIRAPKSKQNEGRCVCGSDHIIKENNQMICDDCGRTIRESSFDILTVADKSRPKGKKMIRSIPHPMSTATKPNIDASMSETIRKAFKGISLREDDDPIEEDNVFDKLKQLDNQFWTRKSELRSDIEELGYTVDEMNAEYVVVSSNDDEDNAYLIPLGGTSRSMTLDFSKARLI